MTTLSLPTELRPCISINNLNYSIITTPHFSTPSEKLILQDVNATITTGSLVCLMAASGGGKTSLISLLARRVRNGSNITLTGHIEHKIEGSIDYPVLSTTGLDSSSNVIRVGYVKQHDFHIEYYSVREQLEMMANLSLSTLPAPQRAERIDFVIAKFGLLHCQHTFISNISGGEKKKLSIAIQVLHNPSVLIIDEIAGLDSSTSYNIVHLLKNLTKTLGITIIMAVHQPRREIFQLFDELILLAKGFVVYNGRVEHVKQYFAEILHHPCPKFTNISDHIIDVTNLDQRDVVKSMASVTRVQNFVQIWRNYLSLQKAKYGENYLLLHDYMRIETKLPLVIPLCRDKLALAEAQERAEHVNPPTIMKTYTTTKKFKQPEPTNPFSQFCVLTARFYTSVYRDHLSLVGIFLQSLFLSFFVGLIYFQLGLDLNAIRMRVSLLYVVNTVIPYVSLILHIYMQTRELVLFDHEQEERLYKPYIYATSRLATFLPIMWFVGIFSMTIIAFMAQIRGTPAYNDLFNPNNLSHMLSGTTLTGNWRQFFYFILFGGVLPNTVIITLSMFVTTIFRHFSMASLLANSLFTVLSFSSGYFIKDSKIPVWLRWTKYISYINHSFHALVGIQFEGQRFPCPEVDPLDPATSMAGPPCIQYTAEYILKQHNVMEPHEDWVIWHIIIICGMVLLFVIISMILITFYKPKVVKVHPTNDTSKIECNKIKNRRYLSLSYTLDDISSHKNIQKLITFIKTHLPQTQAELQTLHNYPQNSKFQPFNYKQHLYLVYQKLQLFIWYQKLLLTLAQQVKPTDFLHNYTDLPLIIPPRNTPCDNNITRSTTPKPICSIHISDAKAPTPPKTPNNVRPSSAGPHTSSVNTAIKTAQKPCTLTTSAISPNYISTPSKNSFSPEPKSFPQQVLPCLSHMDFDTLTSLLLGELASFTVQFPQYPSPTVPAFGSKHYDGSSSSFNSHRSDSNTLQHDDSYFGTMPRGLLVRAPSNSSHSSTIQSDPWNPPPLSRENSTLSMISQSSMKPHISRLSRRGGDGIMLQEQFNEKILQIHEDEQERVHAIERQREEMLARLRAGDDVNIYDQNNNEKMNNFTTNLVENDDVLIASESGAVLYQHISPNGTKYYSTNKMPEPTKQTNKNLGDSKIRRHQFSAKLSQQQINYHKMWRDYTDLMNTAESNEKSKHGQNGLKRRLSFAFGITTDFAKHTKDYSKDAVANTPNNLSIVLNSMSLLVPRPNPSFFQKLINAGSSVLKAIQRCFHDNSRNDSSEIASNHTPTELEDMTLFTQHALDNEALFDIILSTYPTIQNPVPDNVPHATILQQCLPPIDPRYGNNNKENNPDYIPPEAMFTALTAVQRDGEQHIALVKHLSAVMRCGESWMTVGASGSGKSSLLRLLVHQLSKKSYDVIGDVQFSKEINSIKENTEKFPQKALLSQQDDVSLDIQISSTATQLIEQIVTLDIAHTKSTTNDLVGYLSQHDSLLPNLTPFETLLITCKLKLYYLPQSAQIQRVNQIIRELNLTDCAHTTVGGGGFEGMDNNAVKSISGGERRRLALGIILILDPQILLADEPLSSLDSASSNSLTELLISLSRDRQKLLVCTVHCPRDIFMWSHIIILSKSNVIYVGKTQNLIDYFHSIPFLPRLTPPKDHQKQSQNSINEAITPLAEDNNTQNPADWVLDLVAVDFSLDQRRTRATVKRILALAKIYHYRQQYVLAQTHKLISTINYHKSQLLTLGKDSIIDFTTNASYKVLSKFSQWLLSTIPQPAQIMSNMHSQPLIHHHSRNFFQLSRAEQLSPPVNLGNIYDLGTLQQPSQPPSYPLFNINSSTDTLLMIPSTTSSPQIDPLFSKQCVITSNAQHFHHSQPQNIQPLFTNNENDELIELIICKHCHIIYSLTTLSSPCLSQVVQFYLNDSVDFGSDHSFGSSTASVSPQSTPPFTHFQSPNNTHIGAVNNRQRGASVGSPLTSTTDDNKNDSMAQYCQITHHYESTEQIKNHKSTSNSTDVMDSSNIIEEKITKSLSTPFSLSTFQLLCDSTVLFYDQYSLSSTPGSQQIPPPTQPQNQNSEPNILQRTESLSSFHATAQAIQQHRQPIAPSPAQISLATTLIVENEIGEDEEEELVPQRHLTSRTPAVLEMAPISPYNNHKTTNIPPKSPQNTAPDILFNHPAYTISPLVKFQANKIPKLHAQIQLLNQLLIMNYKGIMSYKSHNPILQTSRSAVMAQDSAHDVHHFVTVLVPKKAHQRSLQHFQQTSQYSDLVSHVDSMFHQQLSESQVENNVYKQNKLTIQNYAMDHFEVYNHDEDAQSDRMSDDDELDPPRAPKPKVTSQKSSDTHAQLSLENQYHLQIQLDQDLKNNKNDLGNNNNNNIVGNNHNQSRLPPFWKAYLILLKRQWIHSYRQPDLFWARMSQIVAFTIIIAIYFTQLDYSLVGLQSRMGSYALLLSGTSVGLLNSVAIFPSERNLYYYEAHTDMSLYHPISFFLSYSTIELFWTTSSSLIAATILMFAVNYTASHSFWRYLSIVFTICSTVTFGESLGMIFASIFFHIGFTLSIVTTLITIFDTTAGIITIEPSLLVFPMRILNKASVHWYCSRIMALTDLYDHIVECDPTSIEKLCIYSNGTEFLETFDFAQWWPNLWFLFVATVGINLLYRCIAFIILYKHVPTMKSGGGGHDNTSSIENLNDSSTSQDALQSSQETLSKPSSNEPKSDTAIISQDSSNKTSHSSSTHTDSHKDQDYDLIPDLDLEGNIISPNILLHQTSTSFLLMDAPSLQRNSLTQTNTVLLNNSFQSVHLTDRPSTKSEESFILIGSDE